MPPAQAGLDPDGLARALAQQLDDALSQAAQLSPALAASEAVVQQQQRHIQQLAAEVEQAQQAQRAATDRAQVLQVWGPHQLAARSAAATHVCSSRALAPRVHRQLQKVGAELDTCGWLQVLNVRLQGEVTRLMALSQAAGIPDPQQEASGSNPS